jgi:hypothetical protein
VVLDQAAEVDAGPVPATTTTRAVQDVPVALGPLGQHLVGVLRRQGHHRPHLRDEVGRHPGVHEVRHAVDKDVAGLAPAERLQQRLGWRATPNPGPEVRGSPSVWYFGWPIAFSRLASVAA